MSTETELGDVVERIRKLLRLAHDAGATEHEAAVALERANTLLLRHNLELEQIAAHGGATEAATAGPVEEVLPGGVLDWRGLLWRHLAAHNLCTVLYSRPYDPTAGWVRRLHLIGRPANVRATREMHAWISEQLERQAAAEWERIRERDRWRHVRTWKTGFFRGAVETIAARLAQQRRARQAEAHDPAGAAVNALVVRTDQENAAFIRGKHGEVRTTQHRERRGLFEYDLGAFAEGLRRGGGVGLTPDPRLARGPPPALPD